MIEIQHPFAVGEDRVLVLHDAVRRQATVLLRTVHRTARDRHADAERERLFDLDVDRAIEANREKVMMVRRRGAAGQKKFGERQADRHTETVGREPRPDWIKRREPAEKLLVERLRMGARQRLIEMMVGVDEARDDDVAARIEGLIAGRSRRLAGRKNLCDPAAGHDDAAARVFGKHSERIADPRARRIIHGSLLPALGFRI